MPRYRPHDVNIVLGTLDHSLTSGTTVDKTNSASVKTVLKELDTAFALSEGANKLREIIIHDDEAETSSLRWLPLAEDPAPFYMVAINTSGDQKSETEKRRESVFKLAAEKGNPVKRADAQNTEEYSTETTKNPRPSRHGASEVTKTRRNGGPIDTLILKVPPASRDRMREILAGKKGLCLTVRLSVNSFPQQPFADPTQALDIKIDVYCNGEHVGCSFAPSRARQASNQDELVHRFHGRKVHRVGERPWLLVDNTPLSSGPDHVDTDANTRWRAISEQLMSEANEFNRLENGQQNELAKYVTALAALDIPRQVVDQQRSFKKGFGVIDVVVTLGVGKKYDPTKRYLTDPANMVIKELKANRIKLKRDTSGELDLLNGSTRSLVTGKGLPGALSKRPQPDARRGSGRTVSNTQCSPGSSSILAAEDVQDDGQSLLARTPIKRSATSSSAEQAPKRRRIVDTPGQSSQTTGSLFRSPTPTFQPTPQTIGAADSRLGGEIYGGRSRRSQLKTWDSGRTAEQQFQNIGLERDNTARRQPRETMAGGNAQTMISGTSLTHTHPSPARTITNAESMVQRPLQDVSRLSEESPLLNTKTPSVSALSVSESPTKVAKEALPTPSRPRQRGAPGPEMSDWAPGAVHQDSVLSYDAKKLRQVRSNRSGWFEESSIMFGVRYVIF